MMYFLIGLFVFVGCILLKEKFKDSKLYLIPLIIAILFVSLDFYYMQQGELIDKFYNGGAGIVYRDFLINETTNESYQVDTQLFDWQDGRVGEYLSYLSAEHESIRIIGVVLAGLISCGAFFLFYIGLKYLKLIR